MAAVAPHYRKTKSEVVDMVDNWNNITPEMLLMVDFAFHNTDDTYGDGTSFLDRLYEKLSRSFDIRWNVHTLKNIIHGSNSPPTTFVDILNEILTEEMIACYGV
jgi:hypothetical protein